MYTYIGADDDSNWYCSNSHALKQYTNTWLAFVLVLWASIIILLHFNLCIQQLITPLFVRFFTLLVTPREGNQQMCANSWFKWYQVHNIGYVFSCWRYRSVSISVCFVLNNMYECIWSNVPINSNNSISLSSIRIRSQSCFFFSYNPIARWKSKTSSTCLKSWLPTN